MTVVRSVTPAQVEQLLAGGSDCNEVARLLVATGAWTEDGAREIVSTLSACGVTGARSHEHGVAGTARGGKAAARLLTFGPGAAAVQGRGGSQPQGARRDFQTSSRPSPAPASRLVPRVPGNYASGS